MSSLPKTRKLPPGCPSSDAPGTAEPAGCQSGETFVRVCFPPNTAPAFAAMLLMPWAEEVGWRGLALPRLQRRHGALLGNVFLGVVWAVWHLPMYEVAGVPRSVFPLMLVFFVAGSIVFGWIFNRTHASLLMMLLAHAGAHLSNSHQPLPADTTPLVLHTTAYALAALLLIGFDRVTFARATSRNALV